MAENKGGLEGVVVADITTSKVNGAEGKLVYSGYSIEDLAEYATFEEVIWLLWHTELPTQTEHEQFRARIAAAADLPQAVLDHLKTLPTDANPMAVLRTAVSELAFYDPDAENLTDKDVARQKATRLIGQMASVVAAWIRIRAGEDPVAPRDDLKLADNFLYMMSGEEPDEAAADMINTYLVLLAEHGMNASTFCTRVVTATGSDMHSAVVGGIGTLKGPAHGGANTEAMKMFNEIGSPDNVADWFQNQVKGEGRRIMGMGHRVYKAPDPRAAILKERARVLADASGNTTWYEVAEKLETIALDDDFFKDRKLFPNVDYYSAIALYTLGLDLDMFTPLFAMSRIAGWSAHIIAQMNGRLIRPRANYVGPENLEWTPLEERA